MKKQIKKILGDYLVMQMYDIKIKWFPNKSQTIKKNNELVELSERKLFYNSFVKTNDLCFDVGANVGNRIKPLLSIGARVVAIEPQKSCCKYLKNKFGNNIVIINKGLGETESKKDFYKSSSNTLSSFSNEWINAVKNGRFNIAEWEKPIKIDITTLDNLIEKYGLPKFIKIDVEGYELEVLKGLTKPIQMISFEYTVPEQTNKIVECIRQIEKNATNIECNYCAGENMFYASKEWMSTEEIMKLIVTKEFIDTWSGDIYVRLK